MSDDRLTDERVAYLTNGDSDCDECAPGGCFDLDAAMLAREVQAYRALRPDCVCVNDRIGYDSIGYRCPNDCTDGKMPLDKWVALLIADGERQAEVIAALSNSFATDPRDWGNSGPRDAWRYGVVCGWREGDDDDRDALDEIAQQYPLIDIERMERLYSAQAQHDAVLKMVPKASA